MEINELNANANGGTELVTRGLLERTDPSLWEGIQLITSRLRKLENKKRILHLHDLAGDPEVQHLKDVNQRARFDAMVFCSNWQYQQYRDYLGVEWNQRSIVIPNAIDPINSPEKPTDKIRIIYTSTPHRGLNILVPVFKELYKKYEGKIELDVFSSFSIYGWPERDEPFKELFKECEDHPGINYHGFKPNSVVREALKKANIFAYPSTWQETFCISLVEAMSAECICVHSDLAALPETSGGLTHIYGGDVDQNSHAQTFYGIMDHTIATLVEGKDFSKYAQFCKVFADTRYAWDSVIPRWNGLLESLKNA